MVRAAAARGEDEAAASPDSRRSQLSLDDLSSHSADEQSSPPPPDSRHAKTLNGDAPPPLVGSSTSFGNDTKRVESKLKTNLKQQQEHYARQRLLFDELRRDSILGISPSAFSSSSKSDGNDDQATSKVAPRGAANDDDGDGDAPSATDTRSTKFKLQLQQLQHELTGPSPRNKHREANPQRKRLSSGSELDPDADEIERLQRKAKSIAEYHSRISHSSPSGLHFTRATAHQSVLPPRTRTSRGLADDAHESSNEALRKQLELLRRLQLENNRFRHENRSLREQNDVLEEQSSLHTREIKRLKDEISDLGLRVQHGQLELVTAAQNLRKMKQLQKQLSGVQAENGQLQAALQEAQDQDQQLRLRTQSEIESVVQENKHLKRSLKQVRQHETKLQEQSDELRELVAALETEVGDLKRQLLDTKRDSSEMATRLSEKTSHIEAIESSATQCVERMEAGMEALQKAHNAERDKRKKVEKLRDTLQGQMGTLEVDHVKLQERVQELELFNKQLQQRLQDWKLEKKQDKKFQDEKLAEFLERQKSDAKTIGNLRDDCATFEQQLDTARSAVVEVRKEVAVESNGLRKEVEALRNYVEDAQRAPPPSGAIERGRPGASNESLLDGVGSAGGPQLTRQRREELWMQLPELQFLQGAVGGLRNEMMNFVNDFHRGRHQVRQQAAKLTSAQERVMELEHLRSEDAVTMKELKDQRVLAEQAREIMNQEKMEILKWSQQACEKSERLEETLARCEHSVQGVVKKLRRVASVVETASTDSSEPQLVDYSLISEKAASLGEDGDSVVRLLSAMEREVHSLVAKVEVLVDDVKTKSQESEDHQQRLVRLQRDMEGQRQEHGAVVAEIEALHARSVAEKQQLYSESLQAVEQERDALQKSLDDEQEALAAMQGLNETLKKQVADLEQDVPVFATVVQLFALVVPPLVLQVNDLLTQKRVLVRENAEFAMAQEQVECIGQVLRELVPSAVGLGSESYAEQQRRERRRRFRRVVIAVFALNRFQRSGFGGSAAGTGETVYGVCTSLKPSRKKKPSVVSHVSLSTSSSASSTSCLPPQTMIKVLPAKAILGRLNVRKLVDRLRSIDLTSKVGEVFESSTTEKGTSFGSLLVHVLTTIDPASKEILTENTAGVFHCRALLERRKPARWHEHGRAGSSEHHQEEARLSTVDLIRKRILALGKRLEDLHYQRNALQKENYEFQYQIEQQAAQLKDMDALAHKNEEMQHEINQLQQQQASEAASKDEQLVERDRILQEKQQQLIKCQDKISMLAHEVASFETRVSTLEVEKTDLHHALLVAKSTSAEEEEKLHKSRIGMDKQAEEVRNLKQAAKRAHEMHQKVVWQLEQELIEKASLQAMMDHLRKQKETLELEVSKAKVRAVDESFDADGSDHDGGGGGDLTSQARTHAKGLKAAAAASKEADLSLLASSSSSSYDRHLQDLSDRISRIRGVAVAYEEDEDDAGDDGGGRSFSENQQVHAQRAASGPRRDDFRSEWQRLDISGVFDDEAGEPKRHGHANDDEKEAVVAEREDPHSRRRGVEIDKVNWAVHDYMDRIDEKLQQMYGIPPSSQRQRPATTDTVIHGVSATARTAMAHAKKAAEVRWGDATAFE